MVSMKSCVGSRPWDGSSVSLTTTQLLSQINYMRQTERKRRGMGGSQHELRAQQFLAVLSDTD